MPGAPVWHLTLPLLEGGAWAQVSLQCLSDVTRSEGMVELMLCPGDAPKGAQSRTRPQDLCDVGCWHHGRQAEPGPVQTTGVLTK